MLLSPSYRDSAPGTASETNDNDGLSLLHANQVYNSLPCFLPCNGEKWLSCNMPGNMLVPKLGQAANSPTDDVVLDS